MTFLFHISTFLYLGNWSFSIVQCSRLTGEKDLARQECLEILTALSCLLYSLHTAGSLHYTGAADIAAGTWNCSSWRLTFAREKESPGVETIFIFLPVKYGAGWWERERWGVKCEGWGCCLGIPGWAQLGATAGSARGSARPWLGSSQIWRFQFSAQLETAGTSQSQRQWHCIAQAANEPLDLISNIITL